MGLPGQSQAAAAPQDPQGMRWAPTPSGGPRRGPAAARRRGGRTAAQPARRTRTGKQSPGSGRDAPRVAPSAPIPVPTFARRRPGTLGGENMRKPEAPACGSPASLSPGRQGQRGARANPPPPLHPRVLRGPARPVGPGSPNFLLPAPPPQIPTAPGSEPGQRRALTHLGLPAPPPLPGCSAPGPRSAPCRARPLRAPRLWPPPAALLRAPIGESASRDMGEAGGRRRESLGCRPEGRGSSPGRLLGSPL